MEPQELRLVGSPPEEKIINGNFDICRGTDFTAWNGCVDGVLITGGTTTAYTRQSFTLGQTRSNNPDIIQDLFVAQECQDPGHPLIRK